MKKAFVILTVLLLTGCASSTLYSLKADQRRCEAKSDKFVEIFECTKQQMQAQTNNNPDEMSESARLYLLKGEQLNEQVAENKISDLDAKFEWQKLYVELYNRNREINQAGFRGPRAAGWGWAGYGCWGSRFGCW